MRDQRTFRKLCHRDDGREWSIRVREPNEKGGADVVIRFDVDGEPFERVRPFRSRDEAEREAQRVLDEALADGFEPAPPWLELLDLVMTYWRDDDPEFDAASLRAQVARAEGPSPREVLDIIEGLNHLGPEGEAAMTAAQSFLREHREVTWPALLLSLRHPELIVAQHVAAIVAGAGDASAVPALISVATRGGGRESSAWFEAFRGLLRVDEAAANAAMEAMPRESPSFERQIRDNPGCRIFALTGWSPLRVEPEPKLAIVPSIPRDRAYLVECMWVRARPGERCFVNMFMPERYCEHFFLYYEGRVVKARVDMDEYVPLVASEAPGKPWLYECPARPDFGFDVLREGLKIAKRKLGVALDLAPMLEKRGEISGAIELYEAALAEEPTWDWLREAIDRLRASPSPLSRTSLTPT